MVAARAGSVLTFSVCLILSFNDCLCCTAQAALKGSCAKVDITPPLGITLIGSRGKPSDAVGYICHSRAYEEGGYEPEEGTYLAKGAGEVLIELAVSLVHQVMQTP